jgi:hypothetical protein
VTAGVDALRAALRWPIALVVVALMGLMVSGLVRGVSPSHEPADEVLAYLVPEGHPVSLHLPAGLEEISLTTWAIVPARRPVDPVVEIPYELEIELRDTSGRTVELRHRASFSHLSGEPDSHDPDRYTARLADGPEWLADPRTSWLDVRSLKARGGTLRIAALPTRARAILVRATYPVTRGRVARDLVERGLLEDDKRRMVEGRTALGFSDLEPAARARALSTWGRRLIAVGREGRDYRHRRVLIGELASWPSLPEPRDLGMEIGPRRAAVLVFGTPLRLFVRASAAADLVVREAGRPERAIRAGPDTAVEVVLPGAGPRNVVVESRQRDVRANFAIRATDVGARLGDPPAALLPAGQAEIGPDVRAQSCLALDRAAPVLVRIAPGQSILGVHVRAEIPRADPHTMATGALSVRLSSGTEASHTVRLERSLFERMAGGGDATDATTLQLRVPDRSGLAEIRGDAALCVRPFTIEPDAPGDLLRLPYRMDLGELLRWRNAPYDLRTITPLRAENEDALAIAGRSRQVVTQVRLEGPGAGAGSSGVGAPAPERLLSPEGAPLRRELLIDDRWRPGTALPGDAWTAISPGRRVIVTGSGPHARRLEIVYRADAARLGQEAHLHVDGRDTLVIPLPVRTGAIVQAATSGAHEVALSGLGPGGEAWVAAAPAGGGPIVRRRPAFELASDRDLTFPISIGPRERLTLVLDLTSEGAAERWAVWYSLDGGRAVPQQGFVDRCFTEVAGTLRGRSGDAGTARPWEESGRAPGGRSKARIRLCDDLAPGQHVVRLRLGAAPGMAERLWVRAVLVGQDAPRTPDDTRVWVEE